MTNSYKGKTVVYRIDRSDTNASVNLKCTSTECNVNFAQAIEAADRHINAVYGELGLNRSIIRSFAMQCSIYRLDFGDRWCYIITLIPSEGGQTGSLPALSVPVLKDGKIPILQ